MKKGVSASFGGYQASAGLGGGPGGGALYASAGIPDAGASAGIGGFGNSGASSGFDYGQQGPPIQGGNGGGFFDRIFAVSKQIAIEVLLISSIHNNLIFISRSPSTSCNQSTNT